MIGSTAMKWFSVGCLGLAVLTGCNGDGDGEGRVSASLENVSRETRENIHELVFDVVVENRSAASRPVWVMVYLFDNDQPSRYTLWPRSAREANLSAEGLAVRDPAAGAKLTLPGKETARLANKSVLLKPNSPPYDRFRVLVYNANGKLLFDHTYNSAN
jgi:hypothetical protein